MTEPTITSVHNPRLREAIALRDRRARDRTGRTLVDGVREAWRALEAGLELETVFVCPDLLHGDEAHALLTRLGETDGAAGPQVLEVGRTAHDRLAYGDRSDGLIAVARVPRRALADLELGGEPLVAVLDGLEKPGNLGAILRSADGAGLDALLVAEPATDLYNPNTIRASLGTVFSVPSAAATAGDVRAWLEAQGLQIVVARVDGALPYDQVDYRPPTAIVLGSEARGLGETWRDPAMLPVRLPMRGRADSLNVAATAAVLFYEARRQRGA